MKIFRGESFRRVLLPMAGGIALLFCGLQTQADVIKTNRGDVEGRVLEDSAKVLVVETVAGEYMVVNKTTVLEIQKEPVEDFFYRRGKFQETKGKEDAALLDYLEAVQRNPEHASAKQSIQEINDERAEAKVNVELRKAETFLDGQDYRQALTVYQDVLDMEPNDRLASQVVRRMSDTHAQLAFLFYDHCYDRGAIVELARAEEFNPENAEIYYVLAKIHETDRKFELARLEYERALELNPNHQAARDNLMLLIENTRGRYIQ